MGEANTEQTVATAVADGVFADIVEKGSNSTAAAVRLPIEPATNSRKRGEGAAPSLQTL